MAMLRRHPKQVAPALRLDSSYFQLPSADMDTRTFCFENLRGICDFPIGHFEIFALVKPPLIACWTNTCDEGCRNWTTEETALVEKKLTQMSMHDSPYRLAHHDPPEDSIPKVVTGGDLQYLNLVVTIAFFKAYVFPSESELNQTVVC
jgi:hypothetical protein